MDYSIIDFCRSPSWSYREQDRFAMGMKQINVFIVTFLGMVCHSDMDEVNRKESSPELLKDSSSLISLRCLCSAHYVPAPHRNP